MEALSRPYVIAAIVGAAAMTWTVILGFLTAQAFLFGGQEICPEGLCGLWMYLGLLGAGPASLICGISAGVAARRAATGPAATSAHVWRNAIVAATAVWCATAVLGLACLSVSDNLPPGPANLIRAWFRR